MQSNGKRALRRWQRDGSPEGELTQRTDAENVRQYERAALRRAARQQAAAEWERRTERREL